jgi:hypothetical protein
VVVVVLLIVPVFVALFAGVDATFEACTTVIGAVAALAGLLASGELPGLEGDVWASGVELVGSAAATVDGLLDSPRDTRAVASNTVLPQTSL